MESVKITNQPALGPDRIADLFNEAIHMSSTAPPEMRFQSADGVGAPESMVHDEIRRIRDAQTKLKDVILTKIPDAIHVAAAKGLNMAEAFTFNGNEKFRIEDDTPGHEFPVLFLLKGPADPQQRHELGAAGFVPLLNILQTELAPFNIRHSWTAGTNTNKLTVIWPRH